MTPMELRAARKTLGMTTYALADTLYLHNNGARLVRRWERGEIPISGTAAKAIELLLILHNAQGARCRCSIVSPAPP